MRQIKEIDEAAFDWLSDRPASFWSRAYFPTNQGCKCDVVHNNMCENFNALLEILVFVAVIKPPLKSINDSNMAELTSVVIACVGKT